jgi:hypothetical protein
MASAVLLATPTARGQAAAQAAVARFKRSVVVDDQGFKGMEVSRGFFPADWTLKGDVVWNMSSDVPAQFRMHFSDAQDVSAFDIYSTMTSRDMGCRGSRGSMKWRCNGSGRCIGESSNQ